MEDDMANRSTQLLAWHKECLKNSTAFLEKQEACLVRMLADVEKHRADVAFYQKQIEEAECKNLLAFDRERFLKSRTA